MDERLNSCKQDVAYSFHDPKSLRENQKPEIAYIYRVVPDLLNHFASGFLGYRAKPMFNEVT